jgi:dCTP deaminase
MERGPDDRLVVMPMLDPDTQIGAASIDVRLGTQFRLLRRTIESGLNASEHPQASIERGQERVTVGFGQPLWLHPGQFALGSTLEFLRFPPDLAGYVIGRSSWGRAGLLVATAVMIQPGFAGSLTLELVNHGEGPIALFAGSRVAQIAVHSLDGPAANPYAGRYSTPMGPQVANLGNDAAELGHLERAGARLI